MDRIDPMEPGGHSPAVIDLIGTKRPSRTRSLRTWVTIICLLLASLLIAYFLYRRVATYAFPEVRSLSGEVRVSPTSPESGLQFHNARLGHRGSLAILDLKGSFGDIGWQHGRLMASEISQLQNVLQHSVEESVQNSGFFASRVHSIRLRWRWRSLDEGIPGHQLVEIAATHRGTKASGHASSYENLVRQSAVWDVGAPASGSSGKEEWTMARALSLLVPTTSEEGQRLLVARSLSLPGLHDGGDTIAQNPTLRISRPEGVLSYASLGWPGLAGVVSGVNSESIGVFLHFVKTTDVNLHREAQPTPLLAQEILEHAHSLDEAIAILKEASPLGSAVYVLVDGREKKWAIVERSPETMETRRGETAHSVVDNFIGAKFKDDSILDRSRRGRPMLERQARAKQLLKRNYAQAQDLIPLLGDRKNRSGSTLVLGHRAAIDDPSSVQSAIFDMSSMVLWASDSGDISGDFHPIDLRYLLSSRPEGKEAPPPALKGLPPVYSPSKPTLNARKSDRQALRKARKQLRKARRFALRGDIDQAREWAAHALSLSPNLPEALLVSGQLAREAKDELSARALLQRYLELGADNLQARERVEAWLGRH